MSKFILAGPSIVNSLALQSSSSSYLTLTWDRPGNSICYYNYSAYIKLFSNDVQVAQYFSGNSGKNCYIIFNSLVNNSTLYSLFAYISFIWSRKKISTTAFLIQLPTLVFILYSTIIYIG